MKRNIGKALAGMVLCLPLVFLLSCKKPTEPDTTPGFSITVEDVSCIEAWVRIKSQGIKLPADIVITKNDSPALTFTMTNADTVVMIDSLLPKQTYTLRAFRSDNAKAAALAQCTTMDTTTHNFTWQTWTFGEGSYNTFRDVAIINENDIWAVGEIYMKDSLGNLETEAHNVVNWNGITWKPKKISVLYNGYQNVVPLTGVLSLATGEIIFSSGLPYLPHGNSWKLYHLWDMGILNQNDGGVNRIWGTSMNDIYFTGWKGTIVHYNGSSWTKLESGTTWDLLDIFGYQNPVTAKQEALVASTDNENYNNSMLLKISVNKVQKIAVGTGREIGSVWTLRGFPVYIEGKGVFTNKTGTWKKESIGADFTTSKIRGNGLNDIFVCGVFGLISHYNGYKWQPFYLGSDIVYRSIYVTPNLIVAVGDKSNKAVITVGKR